MTHPRDIIAAVNRRMNRILTMAEAALPPDQFRAYRKLVLEEFGHKGLALDLAALMDERQPERNGKDWAGRNRA